MVKPDVVNERNNTPDLSKERLAKRARAGAPAHIV
jgi:hypothetical protein